MKIVAVIVTYNRLPLLTKSLQAVQQQTRVPDAIIVINNGSTDATAEWLATQQVITYTQENKGGAGGFSFGVNKAYGHGADWIWLMDDDSIPHENALEKLEAALHIVSPHQDKVGFLSSTVVWTDGNLHELNKTYRLNDENKRAGFAFAAESGLPLIEWGTFVSMLLSAKAVEKVGLPISDFFIWCDDAEYAKRIINYGLAGLAVEDSIVLHQTPTNHRSSVLKDPESAIWKYRYGLRNELFTKRVHESELKFWLSWTHRMFVMPFRILLNRKAHRWAFTKLIWQTSLAALRFHPTVQQADGVQATHTGRESRTMDVKKAVKETAGQRQEK